MLVPVPAISIDGVVGAVPRFALRRIGWAVLVHKFKTLLCPQNICPVSVGVAVELTLLKYVNEKPLSILLVRFLETSRREPDTVVSSPIVVSAPPTFILNIDKSANVFILKSV